MKTLVDGDAAGTKIFHPAPGSLLRLVKSHVDLVDETLPAVAVHADLGAISLIRPNEAPLERLQDDLQAFLDFPDIVRGAIAGEQELQDEGRYVGTLLHSLEEILADDPTDEGLVQLMV